MFNLPRHTIYLLFEFVEIYIFLFLFIFLFFLCCQLPNGCDENVKQDHRAIRLSIKFIYLQYILYTIALLGTLPVIVFGLLDFFALVCRSLVNSSTGDSIVYTAIL